MMTASGAFLKKSSLSKMYVMFIANMRSGLYQNLLFLERPCLPRYRRGKIHLNCGRLVQW
jgi:hypothetical protein